MKHLIILTAIIVSIGACAQLPKVYPDSIFHPSQTASECLDLFPQGRWQLYHTIEATIPGGQKSLLTGVTVVSSRQRSIQWALMTLEGFVILSARYDSTLTIDRAVPPFDRPGFTRGVTDDLMLLFFAPQKPPVMMGRLEKGDRVCRYGSPADTTDIVISDDRSWEVRQYDSHRHLVRSIAADNMASKSNTPFAGHMVLKNHGMIGYQLELHLVESISLEE